MDSPASKKMRVLDLPIYLQIDVEKDEDFYTKHKCRWMVIEERDETDAKPAAGELGEDLMVRKTDNDRVRCLLIPDLDPAFFESATAVANSRLFVIGGYFDFESIVDYKIEDRRIYNEMVYIDLEQSNPSWEKSTNASHPVKIPTQAGCVSNPAVSEDGDWIYVIGRGTVVRFHSLYVNNRYSLTDLPGCFHFPELLARIGSKLLLVACPPRTLFGQLFYYHLESGATEIIDSCIAWGSIAWGSLANTVVMVGDSYMIRFNIDHPIPALYVYDLGRRDWLSEPVHGLPNNGIVLPSEDGEFVTHGSVRKVRKDELKFALVWSYASSFFSQTEIHWSKFKLRIQESENKDIEPTFHAESLSTGSCYGGFDCHLINSTAG